VENIRRMIELDGTPNKSRLVAHCHSSAGSSIWTIPTISGSTRSRYSPSASSAISRRISTPSAATTTTIGRLAECTLGRNADRILRARRQWS
jgi:hypothetical protein